MLQISNAEYRKSDGISSTELKKIAISPMHYRFWKDNPQEDTPALLFGRAAHKYMLEKDDFFNEFAVAPNINRRTNAGKEEWAKFVEDNKGKDVITQDDLDKAKAMYEVLYKTPFVDKLLSGKKELSFFATDETTGLKIKARPDCLLTIGDTTILIDYKTCENADTERFMNKAIDLKYDLQLYHYKYVLELNGIHVDSVMFIAQEKSAPYCVNVLEASEGFLASGKDMFETYMGVFKECTETNNWYGYVNGEVNTLNLPKWLQKMYE